MIYNPLDTFYKSKIGAVSSADSIRFRVKGNFDSVLLLLRKDGDSDYSAINMQGCNNIFETTVNLDTGLYFYTFKTNFSNYIVPNDFLIGEVSSYINEYQLTVYDSDFVTPDWIKGGVIYQIFPDRFYRYNKNKSVPTYKILREDWGGIPYYKPDEKGEVLNNDFFGGDLKGIESKLEYLSSLGVTCIYLNPIFEAYSNHRYDTANYFSIDPLLGDMNDLKSLIDNAKKYDIKIILDGVFNHTGSDSIYFNKEGRYDSLGAFQSPNSPYYNWFKFIKYPKEYESWWGIKTLPATDKTNVDFINYVTGENGVINKYVDLGVDGFRLDVVDELPTDFVRHIRSSCKCSNKNSIIIGEVWEDASNKISYGVRRQYFQGKELDSVMNYPLKNAILDFVVNLNEKQLIKVINEQIDHYPSQVLHSLMNILSTHDTARLLSVVSGVKFNNLEKEKMANFKLDGELLNKAIFRTKCATLLQFFLCGVPSVYYGDEVGMQGFIDPFNRGCFPWGSEDNDMLCWYKTLSKIRKSYSCFKNGEYSTVFSDKGFIVFKRNDKNSEVLIVINLSDKEYDLTFDGMLTDLITKKKYEYYVNICKQSYGLFINSIKNK